MRDEDWYRAWGPPARATGRPDLDEIVPELLVGEFPVPDDVSWLREAHRVTAVLNLQDDGDLKSRGLDLRDLDSAYRNQGILFRRIPITDGDAEMLVAQLERATTFLAEQARGGHRTYLHCNAGMNRAPTIAIAYLHVHHGLSLRSAHDFVKARRCCAPYMAVLESHFGDTRSQSRKADPEASNK